MATFKEQIEALAEQHDLSSISITFYRGGASGKFWGAYAQGGGFIGSSDKLAPPAECLAEALTDLRARRDQPVLVPELAEVA